MKVVAEIEMQGPIIGFTHGDAPEVGMAVRFTEGGTEGPWPLYAEGVEIGKLVRYPDVTGDLLWTDQQPVGYVTQRSKLEVILDLPVQA